MSAGQANATLLSARAWKAARELAAAEGLTGSDDIVVHADPAGAANLMREVIALHTFDVALEEHDGHWQVVVRGGPHPESVLARVVDLTAGCVERGLMHHATLCVGKRTFTIQAAPGRDVEVPACAA
jgi:hypothetical protein